MTTTKYVPIGTVSDAARTYRCDVAAIWAWITSERRKMLSDGSIVQLHAERKRDSDPWLVTAEVTTTN